MPCSHHILFSTFLFYPSLKPFFMAVKAETVVSYSCFNSSRNIIVGIIFKFLEHFWEQ
jgi:hypothetical protein